MKINYYAETDSLYIDLSSSPSVNSIEISDGIVVDYDANGKVTGIDIDHARENLDLAELTTSHFPITKQAVSA